MSSNILRKIREDLQAIKDKIRRVKYRVIGIDDEYSPDNDDDEDEIIIRIRY